MNACVHYKQVAGILVGIWGENSTGRKQWKATQKGRGKKGEQMVTHFSGVLLFIYLIIIIIFFFQEISLYGSYTGLIVRQRGEWTSEKGDLKRQGNLH